MTTSTSQIPSPGEKALPKQFIGFFDDAAVFPPGLAPLQQAVVDHVERRSNRLNDAVGPTVLPLSDLYEAQDIASGLHLGGRPIAVSAVIPAGQLQAALEISERVSPELQLVSLEVKTDSGEADIWNAQIAEAAQVKNLPVYVELTADQIQQGALKQLEGTGLRLKYRTGGIESHLFPSPEQLGAVVIGAVTAGIAFKLTAGLHEAIRYTNPATGFTHHGFLNIALATEAARAHEPEERVTRLLIETDPAQLVNLAEASDGSWRESFMSFGTCSVGEPAESLERLGLFPHGLA